MIVSVKRHPELTPWRHEELTPPGCVIDGRSGTAERVVHGVHRGDPRRERAPLSAQRAAARGVLWTLVGDLRSRCGTALSVAPKAARRLDAGQFVEIEIEDRLQRLAGGAVAQHLGQRLEPRGILRL